MGTISGPVAVAIILVILIWLLVLTRRTAQSSVSSGNDAPAVKRAAAPSVNAAPVVQAGIGEEIVAVISAAVCSYMDSAAPGTQYVIRGIRRASSERPVWGFAGMQQNTRPF